MGASKRRSSVTRFFRIWTGGGQSEEPSDGGGIYERKVKVCRIDLRGRRRGDS